MKTHTTSFTVVRKVLEKHTATITAESKELALKEAEETNLNGDTVERILDYDVMDWELASLETVK